MTAPPFLILKIGGSLFSDKKQHRHIDKRTVQKFARLVAGLAQHAPGQIALVVGGGSFGHGAVRNADAADSFSVLDLTEANFSQKWIWTQALRVQGTAAIPLQLTSMCTLSAGKLILYGNILHHCLALGIVPVLSGDCLIGSDGALHVLGSDRVPEALLQVTAKPVRIVALTGTPGIARGDGNPEILREVDADFPQLAFESLWKAPEYDTTEGMKGKLQALVDMARQGAECFVMKGNSEVDSLTFLFKPLADWPSQVLYTRISRL
jgi:isopentenyl phosphate kinase